MSVCRTPLTVGLRWAAELARCRAGLPVLAGKRPVLLLVGQQRASLCTGLSRRLQEVRYSKDHEWVRLDEANIGTVGISEHAQASGGGGGASTAACGLQEALGEIVFAQLPDVGTQLAANDECGALESVKSASDIYCPVSGAVTEKNGNVEDEPSLINKSPLADGWLFRIDLSSPAEFESLMSDDDYKTFIQSQQADS